jgi:arabinofuranan 3-O-arabinosyltransferase
VPGADVSRPLRVPALPGSWGTPEEILLSAEAGAPVCRTIGRITRCDADRDGLGEDGTTIDRIVSLATAREYGGGLEVVPRQSPALTDAFSGDVRLRTTSTQTVSTRAGILAAIDGRPRTGWISALKDVTPEITIELDGRHTLSALRLAVDPSLAASAPRRATLEFSDGRTREVRFDDEGRTRFPAVRTSSVRVLVTDAYVRSSLSFDGSGTGLPIGISEITFPGSDVLPSAGSGDAVRLACGSGPDLTVNGKTLRTQVWGSRDDVVAGRELPADVCGVTSVPLAEGDNRLTTHANLAFRPGQVRLSTFDAVAPTSTGVPVTRDGRESIAAGPVTGDGTQVVTLAQNVNPGWTADGRQAVTVNGWMQGWLASPGDTVQARFGIGRVYQAGLVLGALGVLALLVATWRLRRRPGPAIVDRPAHGRVRLVVGALAGAVLVMALAGPVGLVVSAVVGGLVLASRGRVGGWVAAVGVGAAGAGYVLRPWTDPRGWAGAEAWPQWCVLAALSAVAVLVFELPLRTSLSRIAGRSTSR